MSEEVKTEKPEEKTEAPKEEKVEAVSFEEALKPKEETVEAKTEEAPEKEAVKVEAQAEEAVVVESADEKTGLLAGIQAERKKRQEWQKTALEQQREIERMKAEAPLDVAADDGSQFKNQILGISESSARMAHKDFQPNYDAFYAAVFDGETINRQLYDSVMNSPHPGEAAYQAGKLIKFQQKFGYTLDEQIPNLEKDLEARMKDKWRKEVEAEFNGKVAVKEKQPTNILSTRSAGTQVEAPFRPTTFADILGSNKRR